MSLLIVDAIVLLVNLGNRWLLCRLHSPIAEIISLSVAFFIMLLLTAFRQHNWKAIFTKANILSLVKTTIVIALFLILWGMTVSKISPEWFVNDMTALLLVSTMNMEPLFSWGRQRSLLNLFNLLNTGGSAQLQKFLAALPVENLNQQLSGADTPLIHAIKKHGKQEIISLLLEHGADPNLPSAAGIPPLLIAFTSNHHETVDLLLRYGANFEPKSDYSTLLLHQAVVLGISRWWSCCSGWGVT